MATQDNYQFIIIDDDPMNNVICRSYIKKLLPGALVHTFLEPEEALAFIRAGYNTIIQQNTVLLIDINMPSINGWEVLRRIKELPCEVKDRFCIYMLSSSICIADQQRARDSEIVLGFIEKPLSIAKLQHCLPTSEDRLIAAPIDTNDTATLRLQGFAGVEHIHSVPI